MDGWPVGAVLARKGPLGIQWSRGRSANLVCTRRAADKAPRIWLAAHLDSKSQAIPMLVRVASVAAFGVLLGTMMVALLAMWIMSAREGAVTPVTDLRLRYFIEAASILAALSLLPMILCFVGNRSPGAADNASGVAAVLLAAERLGHRDDVGVLITSAEELALAGARAFTRETRGRPMVINCDTVDDDGQFICMSKGWKPERLVTAVEKAASQLGIEARVTRMLPGVLADNVAFTDAEWQSITISRGNLGTLARVHTAGDHPDRLTGAGVAQAARLLAATVKELT